MPKGADPYGSQLHEFPSQWREAPANEAAEPTVQTSLAPLPHTPLKYPSHQGEIHAVVQAVASQCRMVDLQQLYPQAVS